MNLQSSVAAPPARAGRPQRVSLAALVLIGALLMLSGCGQKGPLTLPAVPASPAASAPAQ